MVLLPDSKIPRVCADLKQLDGPTAAQKVVLRWRWLQRNMFKVWPLNKKPQKSGAAVRLSWTPRALSCLSCSHADVESLVYLQGNCRFCQAVAEHGCSCPRGALEIFEQGKSNPYRLWPHL
jgi:hypothetical protein